MNDWSGSRSLVSATPPKTGSHWGSSRISCCCPMSCCCFGSVDSSPSNASTFHRYGGYWANSQAWVWAWVVAELVFLLAFPHCHFPSNFSSTVLASSPNATYSKEQGQFSYSQILRSRSPILTSPEPALLFCPSKV